MPVFNQIKAEDFKPTKVLSMERTKDKFLFHCDVGIYQITFYSDEIVQVVYFPTDTIKYLPMYGILPSEKIIDIETTDNKSNFRLISSKIVVRVDKTSAEITFTPWSGTTLLRSKEIILTAVNAPDGRKYKLTSSFYSPEDENIYGLGQHQQNWMNHRSKVVRMWHNTEGEGGKMRGEEIAIPFLITNKNYGFIFDNASKTRVFAGIDNTTRWEAEIGDGLSYFFIYGKEVKDIYASYRELIGTTPLPPKGALGYIQCKQKYQNQNELLDAARRYREKKYPLDYLVVDWYHWDILGDMDFNAKYWPDPKRMNDELNNLNISTMISCWPRYRPESKNFDVLEKNGWFMRDSSGRTEMPQDRRGGLIDITNPKGACWYWNKIKTNYVSKGFDSYWLDESEPDTDPHGFFFYEKSGNEIFNFYPYLHSKNVYTNHRKDLTNRCLILTRSSYLGAQQWGTTFWSGDIHSNWDVLERQIPAGLNFCASGMPYWSSDIGGWDIYPFDPNRPRVDKKDLLIYSEDVPEKVKDAPDFQELYVRWFQFGAFCPTFRAHGGRENNEVWSYGTEVEKILVRYLKLRYALMPYIYSNAYITTQTGLPIMRPLFIDFMKDPAIADIKDEFMFGESLLVAPVVKQGQQEREVYLPAGVNWYNFWTNEKISGSRKVKIKAPVEILPLLVKEGTILPFSPNIQYATEKSDTIDIQIYPGKDAEFTLYEDEGNNYNYENGMFSTIRLSWSNNLKVFYIGEVKGGFPGMTMNKVFNIILIKEGTLEKRNINYSGEKMQIKF
jgi:alpha-glucosidase (family GH31 glycosyl hydrolase)